MAGVASEDLRKDVVARCRSEESATNTEAEITRRPALAVNVVSVRRFALTSAGRSAPTTPPSPRLEPSTLPATKKTVCRCCGGRPQQTRSECPAYGIKCTACNRLHHFADVCESRHNPLPSIFQDTVSPHTADVNACSLAPVDDLVTAHQYAGHSNQLYACVRHIATHRRHTIAKPNQSDELLPQLTIHSEVRIQDPHTKSWDQCGAIVKIGARRAYRVRVSCAAAQWTWVLAQTPFPSPCAGFLRATAALYTVTFLPRCKSLNTSCGEENLIIQSKHTSVIEFHAIAAFSLPLRNQRESRYGMEFDHTGVFTLYNDILSCFSLSLSHFSFADLTVFGLKGRGDDTHCTMQSVRHVVRPRSIRLLVQRK